MITGQLMPGFLVQLDPRTAAHSGSWIPHSGDPLQAYGQEIIQLFYELIRKRSPVSVFDIGASTGSFCLLAKWIPQMTCVAIEPSREVHGILRQNIDLNGLTERVHLPDPIALSNYTGEATLMIHPAADCSGLSFIDDRSVDYTCRREKVPVTTLDQLTNVRIDAIKLDVEHSESAVLQGGESLIRKWRPLILLEATLPHITVPLLKSWGYHITDYQTDLLATYEK